MDSAELEKLQERFAAIRVQAAKLGCELLPSSGQYSGWNGEIPAIESLRLPGGMLYEIREDEDPPTQFEHCANIERALTALALATAEYFTATRRAAFGEQAVPSWIREALERYVSDGIPTGSFLRACLENNLTRAVVTADSDNALRLSAIAAYIVIHVPQNAWGSERDVSEWLSYHADRRLMGALECPKATAPTSGESKGER